ncbi:MAG: mechanosensitive ion channel family protein [Candidatus Sericytochromatia bacterium]
MKEFFQKISEMAAVYSTNFLGALLILVIGIWISRRLARLFQELLGKTHLDNTFVVFAGNVIRILFYGLVILAALNNVGVPMTSVLALLGTAGLAVALALKDSLNNVAAGISLLILRPFRVGEYVELGGIGGTVLEINFFHTFLNSPDNRRIVIPNAKVISDTIINFSHNENRRIDLVIGIGYGCHIGEARDVIQGVLDAEERLLKDPPAVIAVGELAPSSVNLFVRPWVKTSEYLDTKFALQEQIKDALAAANIEIAFPQQDVNLKLPPGFALPLPPAQGTL